MNIKLINFSINNIIAYNNLYSLYSKKLNTNNRIEIIKYYFKQYM